MVSENSREALGVRNMFSYVDNIGRLEGSNPKANTKFLIQARDYKQSWPNHGPTVNSHLGNWQFEINASAADQHCAKRWNSTGAALAKHRRYTVF